MQIIKYCMLFLVFITSTLIGRYIAKQYRYRLEELEEIKKALNIFKSKIKFTYDPIPDIFYEISKNTSSNISNLFILAKEKMNEKSASLAWEEAVNDTESNLKKEDRQAVKTLSKLLRYYRCRGTNKSNRSYRKLCRKTNTRGKIRKKQKWENV